MDKKIKTLSVYRKNLAPNSSSAPENNLPEVLISESVYEPAFGKLLKETQFGEDGQVEQLMSYGYDANGFLTDEELLDGDGSVLEKRSFEPDAQGRVAREFIHYADGSADRIEYSFDGQGRLVKKERFDDEGETESLEQFEYQGDKLLREWLLDAEGELVAETVYTFNEQGLLIEIQTENTEEDLWFRKVYRYNDAGMREAVTTFNQDGEPIERVLFENDEAGRPVQIIDENRRQKNTLRMEYNEKGDVIFQEEHDMNGELVNQIERIYNQDGRLSESHILVRNFQRGVSRNYSLRNEYTFFEE